MKEHLKETSELIIRDFEIESVEKEEISEEELFGVLADQIAYMLEYRIEFLFSLMYRLDVYESKINAALHPSAPEPANIGLARLVLERQKQRIKTKNEYRPSQDDRLKDMEF